MATMMAPPKSWQRKYHIDKIVVTGCTGIYQKQFPVQSMTKISLNGDISKMCLELKYFHFRKCIRTVYKISTIL